MTRRLAVPRRPSNATCDLCGQPTWLVDCGVDAHRRPRTRREQLDGRCPGRVYVHAATGGIECEHDEDIPALT